MTLRCDLWPKKDASLEALAFTYFCGFFASPSVVALRVLFFSPLTLVSHLQINREKSVLPFSPLCAHKIALPPPPLLGCPLCIVKKTSSANGTFFSLPSAHRRPKMNFPSLRPRKYGFFSRNRKRKANLIFSVQKYGKIPFPSLLLHRYGCCGDSGSGGRRGQVTTKCGAEIANYTTRNFPYLSLLFARKFNKCNILFFSLFLLGKSQSSP